MMSRIVVVVCIALLAISCEKESNKSNDSLAVYREYQNIQSFNVWFQGMDIESESQSLVDTLNRLFSQDLRSDQLESRGVSISKGFNHRGVSLEGIGVTMRFFGGESDVMVAHGYREAGGDVIYLRWTESHRRIKLIGKILNQQYHSSDIATTLVDSLAHWSSGSQVVLDTNLFEGDLIIDSALFKGEEAL